MARPIDGPDDPRAMKPQRGRPFKPGNPYRMQPGQQPGTPRKYAPASRAPSSPAQPRPAYLQTPQAAPRLAVTPAQPGAPRIDRQRPAPTRSVPSPIPAASPLPRQGYQVPRQTGDQLRPIRPYQPCAWCAEEGIRDRRGTWPAAVAQVEVWETASQRFEGRYYLCGQHFPEAMKNHGRGVKVRVTERA